MRRGNPDEFAINGVSNFNGGNWDWRWAGLGFGRGSSVVIESVFVEVFIPSVF
jgi:hypothetical protein